MLISGTVKVWDPRQKDTPVVNMEPVEGETKRDCWTVAFGKIAFPSILKKLFINKCLQNIQNIM